MSHDRTLVNAFIHLSTAGMCPLKFNTLHWERSSWTEHSGM